VTLVLDLFAIILQKCQISNKTSLDTVSVLISSAKQDKNTSYWQNNVSMG